MLIQTVKDCDIHCAASLPPEQLQILFACQVQLPSVAFDRVCLGPASDLTITMRRGGLHNFLKGF